MKFGQGPCTIVQGVLSNFGATLKIHKKSNFDQNQLKISTQHKKMYMYQKKNIKMENSLLVIFHEILPRTLYYSTVCFVRFWSKKLACGNALKRKICTLISLYLLLNDIDHKTLRMSKQIITNSKLTKSQSFHLCLLCMQSNINK